MKSLDEVIAYFDYQTQQRHVYLTEDADARFAEALHYLKEYKKDQEDPDGDHQQLIKAQKLLSEFFQNEPLSWADLKEMVGKPVWVQWTVKGEWHHGDWNLVHALIDDRIWFVDGNGEITDVPEELMDETWKAYRKEVWHAAV